MYIRRGRLLMGDVLLVVPMVHEWGKVEFFVWTQTESGVTFRNRFCNNFVRQMRRDEWRQLRTFFSY